MKLFPKFGDDHAVSSDLSRLVRESKQRDEIDRLRGENRRLREDLDAANAEIARLSAGGIFDVTRPVDTIRVGDV